MLFGVFRQKNQEQISRDDFLAAAANMQVNNGHAIKALFPDSRIAFGYVSPFMTGAYQRLAPVSTSEGDIAVVFSGQVYNYKELAGLADITLSDAKNLSTLVLALYKKFGAGFVEKINGKFAYAIWDKTQQRIILGRDRFGIEPLYYYLSDKLLVFASSIAPVSSYLNNSEALNFPAVCKFLLFGYNPGIDTFYTGIRKLQPSSFINVRSDMQSEHHRYWELKFEDILHTGESNIAEELKDYLQNAVECRMEENSDYGVFVSGGMDSSSVLGLSAHIGGRSPYTFSYRCRGESYDESPYARLMANSVNSTHSEIEYTPLDVLSMQNIAASMDEPFCDVGINIATYLLGRAAHESVPYVLTGDGGDELFGGHPVYEADKIARYIDQLPGFIKSPLFSLAGILPDSDQKKNLTVKVKRFAESLNYPEALFSHRWRIYYQPAELKQLLSDAAYEEIMSSDLYEDILSRNKEAAGLDLLSRSLYSDYFTVTDFYLRRNDINRMFGLETRYPLLDHGLVEYCARIPADLKIRGWFDTKYIFKKSMETVLPREIVYRKDKLGHSIPLKNWLRDKSEVKEFVLDLLAESTVRRRGLFKADYISNLIKDHMEKRRNNSHRIWTLAVLEMWLRGRKEPTGQQLSGSNGRSFDI